MKTNFCIVRIFHRPWKAFKNETEKHYLIRKSNCQFYYTVQRHMTCTEFNLHYDSDYNASPVDVNAVVYLWPRVAPVPEEFEETFVRWMLKNVPGEAVASWLVIQRDNKIIAMAMLVEVFAMYSLDYIDPRTQQEEALQKLQEIKFVYYGSGSNEVNVLKYYALKDKYPEVREHYKFMEKYIELLSDDITTMALRRAENYVDMETASYLESSDRILWIQEFFW